MQKKVEVNVDPTFLLERREWGEIIADIKIDYPYVLVYALEINKNLIHLAREISREKGLEIIFLDMKNRYGKNAHSKYTASPDEFLYYIKNAEYVITNSFHGTVFSVIFEKIPFGCTQNV